LRVKRELLAAKLTELEKTVIPKKQHNNGAPLPAQYGKAQRVTTEDDTDSVISNDYVSDEGNDTDPSDDDDLAALARAMNSRTLPKRCAFMTRTSILEDEPTVRAHTEYYGAVACNNTSNIENTIVISDSGADTTILNDSWLLLTSLKACRLANLVGYDPGLGTKKGLPIVDAVAKVTTQAGKHVLVGIHEGVLNSGSPTH